MKTEGEFNKGDGDSRLTYTCRIISKTRYAFKPHIQCGQLLSEDFSRYGILFAQELVTNRTVIPSWLERDRDVGRVIGYPRREDSDADIREDLIVEFYAR